MELNPADIDTEWVITLLKGEANNRNIIEVVDVGVSFAVVPGDNFTSTLYRVIVKVLLGSGRSKKISVIVKVAPPDDLPISRVVKTFHVFKQEVEIYDMFPHFEDLMDEFDDKREVLWPQCYGHKLYNVIAFSDLQAQGFKTLNRKEGLTLEQTIYALRSFGRFHAMSKILLERGTIVRDNCRTHFLKTDSESFQKSIPGCCSVLSSAIEESWDSEWKWLAKRIENQGPTVCTKLKKLMTTFDQRFEVLCHGDPWTTNLMWKFSEYDNTPIALRLVDFQFSIVNSLVFDVCYLIYLVLPPKTRREHLRTLIHLYQESLEKNLKLFHWKGYIPTADDIFAEIERIQYIIFGMLIYSYPVTTGSVDNTYDLGLVLDHPPEVFLSKGIYTEDKYAKEICHDLQELCDKGVI